MKGLEIAAPFYKISNLTGCGQDGKITVPGRVELVKISVCIQIWSTSFFTVLELCVCVFVQKSCSSLSIMQILHGP
jgi:hypothetical protein